MVTSEHVHLLCLQSSSLFHSLSQQSGEVWGNIYLEWILMRCCNDSIWVWHLFLFWLICCIINNRLFHCNSKNIWWSSCQFFSSSNIVRLQTICQLMNRMLHCSSYNISAGDQSAVCFCVITEPEEQKLR